MFSARTGWKLAPNAFTQALEKRRAAGGEVLDLTESNPTRCGLQYDQAAILAALAQPAALDYRPEPRGLLSAREAVAGYYRERAPGVAAPGPEHIFLTTSTSEAYSWLFRLLCDPGDEVLVPVPSYPLFEFLAGLEDVRLVPYLLLYDHGWQIDFHFLEKALSARTRAVLVVSPNNPTGSYVKTEELANLGWLCAPRQIALIADEVFLDYPHDRRPRHSLAGQRDLPTFALSGLSKIAALPQMKLAWIAAGGPQELLAPALERLEVIADTYLSLSAPQQLALPALLEQRHALQEQLTARIAQNLAELDRQLAKQKACTRLEAEGGWYAVLRVPATRSDEELTIALLEQQGVLVHPGHFYDFPADGHLVLSLITPVETFTEGVRRVLAFCQAA